MATLKQTLYQPDWVPHPGLSLAEVLDDRGISQVELAQRIGKSEKAISQIINGESGITASTALDLERILSIPVSFWMNLERLYQEHCARQQNHLVLEAELGWLDQLPLKAMIKAGYIGKLDNDLDQLREVLEFFGIASPKQWTVLWSTQAASFRISQAFKPDQFALGAWLRQGEITSAQIDCDAYDREQLLAKVSDFRRLTTEPPEVFQRALTRDCAACGVAVAFVPELPKTYVAGATRWLAPGKALVQLSLRYKTDDHLWFAFFHECYHVLFGKKRGIILEGVGVSNDPSEEHRADKWAQDQLIPPAQYARLSETKFDLSRSAVVDFAQQVGVAPGIVVGRLQHDKHLPLSHLNDLKRKFSWH